MAPDKEIRILIVDDQREVARVLRTSLELLDRGYYIIDVPSAEEAFLESGPFDLLVTDYRLPGINGLELVARMREGDPALKSVVITGYSSFDAEQSAEELEDLGVLQVFQKPIEMEDFTALVAETLGGQKRKARADEATGTEEDTLAFKEGPIALMLTAIHDDLGADAVALVDRQARVVQQHGTTRDDLRFSELVVLLAGNFTTTGEISAYLGDDDAPTAIHYYGGGNHDIYSVALGLHHFLAIVYPPGNGSQIEAVAQFGMRAAINLLPLVGEEMVPRLDDEPQEEPAPEAEAYEPEPEDEVEVTAPESIDLDALEAALEAAKSEDADSFWDKVVEDDSISSAAGKAISLDEAIDLGLIPKDLGDDS
jgi:CheY-like chemotaxis protein